MKSYGRHQDVNTRCILEDNTITDNSETLKEMTTGKSNATAKPKKMWKDPSNESSKSPERTYQQRTVKSKQNKSPRRNSKSKLRILYYKTDNYELNRSYRPWRGRRQKNRRKGHKRRFRKP